MGWENQGRQEHGWFGNGTGGVEEAPGTSKRDSLFEPDAEAQRIQAVIHGATGALPASSRGHAAARPNAATVARLTDLMVAWDGAAGLDPATFADRFFDRDANDPVVDKLRDAARLAVDATNHTDLRKASETLADAQQAVGMDRWNRFVADAASRVTDSRAVDAQRSEKGASGAVPVSYLNSKIPVPFHDDQGHQVLDENGKPMMMPSDADPHFFVDAGRILGSTGLAGGLAGLAKFRQGGAWDLQRVGSDRTITKDFTNFSTVAIGLYGAAAGIPQNMTLSVEDRYAARNSNFGPAKMDKTFTHLPEVNVSNTRLGYDLFTSGRIGTSPMGEAILKSSKRQ